MTGIPSLALPGRITAPDPERVTSPPVPMDLPPLRDLHAADGPRLSIALMDGVFVMPRKPYVALPAPVRRSCGALAGSRLLLVADPVHGVLIVHPEAVVQAMLRAFHTSLAAREETS